MPKFLDFMLYTKRGILLRTAIFVAIGLTIAYFGKRWWDNRPPEKEEIPIGFTWISSGVDENGDPWGVLLEETNNLRITYTTGMTVVQNKEEPESEPYVFSDGRWYFRATPRQLFKVAVVAGNTLVTSFDDVMVVSNDAENCPDENPCPAGAVYLLTVELEPIYVETSARQYVVINP